MTAFVEKLDATDLRLLAILQEDASLSLDALADRLSVATNTCWRRVKRLEDAGIIMRRVSIIDPVALGYSQTVFVQIRTHNHSEEWFQAFSKTVQAIPEIIEFYRMAGDVDYMLKILCRSVSDYDRVYKSLIRQIDVADVSATFAMECLKNTTEIPLGAP